MKITDLDAISTASGAGPGAAGLAPGVAPAVRGTARARHGAVPARQRVEHRLRPAREPVRPSAARNGALCCLERLQTCLVLSSMTRVLVGVGSKVV